ncbi:MAG: MgtC/SapB family protein [Bacteroidia bacterium]|jgi:putative Mg2+ transporter-C (MgtC) family protein|nr:MgtC/SapB family protein [Bacteroidia bacterium]
MNIGELAIGQFEHRLLLAFVAGTIIGMERQWKHKIAGVKTNALVAGGAALFVLIAEKITVDGSAVSRIAANIITGVGFLGAGVMMKNGTNIVGINTAATIWCSAAVGALAGLGFWYESLVGTFFVVIGNIILQPLGTKIEAKINRIQQTGNRYQLTLYMDKEIVNEVKETLVNLIHETETLHIASLQSNSNGEIIAEINSLDKRQSDLNEIVENIQQKHAIQSIRWVDLKSE